MQEFLGFTRNFRQEVPGRARKPKSGTGYRNQEAQKSFKPGTVPGTLFLVGSWLRPYDFGFGHPLELMEVIIQIKFEHSVIASFQTVKETN